MKLILSRKGFDSSSGGCPSPVFPDKSMIAMPIPDERSGIRYEDIDHRGTNFGQLVNDLTKGKITPGQGAHLDPDLCVSNLSRKASWIPCLGQSGAAQGHLAKQQVTEGDLFVFFGLFKEVVNVDGIWLFRKNAKPQHIIWGWLQIDRILKVDDLTQHDLSWLSYHPHVGLQEDRLNTLYIAKERLQLPGLNGLVSGAGVFNHVKDKLVLTRPDGGKLCDWQLPLWFHPSNSTEPLTYHSNLERWSKSSSHCFLNAVARGQEFVLQNSKGKEVVDWLFD